MNSCRRESRGRLSRRQMLARAAQLGIAAPVIGVMLHATSDMAFGAPLSLKNRILRLSAQDAVPLEITGPTAPKGTQAGWSDHRWYD